MIELGFSSTPCLPYLRFNSLPYLRFNSLTHLRFNSPTYLRLNSFPYLRFNSLSHLPESRHWSSAKLSSSRSLSIHLEIYH